ncbi:uncharacterized protein LOC110118676 [Ceratitis capitata]|uniref:uncharacterized protein LOC110118676 n=1 Tax=Ceratitis capitata TaxID=7213 RepID=UPI000A0FCC09|nr:uncharacterized protein LOC110118676 [Ceratitis capitata]
MLTAYSDDTSITVGVWIKPKLREDTLQLKLSTKHLGTVLNSKLSRRLNVEVRVNIESAALYTTCKMMLRALVYCEIRKSYKLPNYYNIFKATNFCCKKGGRANAMCWYSKEDS